MAWNEPGNNNNDPWKNRGGKEQGPPDLDELFKDLGNRFNGLFGSKGSGSSSQGGKPQGALGVSIILILAVVIWLLSGIYTIKPAERGVVLTFGQFTSIVEPGIQWKATFVQEVIPVDVKNLNSLTSTGLMLTEDENVVSVEMTVQYVVNDPKAYLFAVSNPVNSLQEATDSALRLVIGHSKMDDILTSGRTTISKKTEEELIRVIEPYGLGLIIKDVLFKGARPPEQVKAAFDDAIAAQEDEERYVNQANAYVSEVEPSARAKVNRMIKEATAYKDGKILMAEGQVAKFEQLLPEYKVAPEVTRQRLYLETMERVFANTSKVLVDTEGSGNMMYLPLDKLMQHQNSVSSVVNSQPVTNLNTGSRSTSQPVTSSRNSRDGRYRDGRN